LVVQIELVLKEFVMIISPSIFMDMDCEEIMVPKGVLKGIEEIYNGNTASKEDLEEAFSS